MAETFHLTIVTLDGVSFEGEAEMLTCRTVDGDVSVMPGHISYVSPLGMGVAKVYTGGEVRHAACMGGLLTVKGGDVRLVPTTFEWAEDIDLDRAERARAAAEEALRERAKRSDHENAVAEAKLKRALVRRSAATL